MTPGVGSPVRLVVNGRIGKIVDHCPSDLTLPYKIAFSDGGDPETDWVNDDAIEKWGKEAEPFPPVAAKPHCPEDVAENAASAKPSSKENPPPAVSGKDDACGASNGADGQKAAAGAPSGTAIGTACKDLAVKHDLAVYREAMERLNSQLGDNPTIKAVSDYLRLPPLAVASAGVAGIAAFCLWGFCGQFISTVLGVMVPAFESFKCVEEFSNIQDPAEIYMKASNIQFWLIYWIVAAVFASIEYIFYCVLIWIPFYYPLKLAVLLWLYMPKTRGANHIYHWVVKPVLKRNRHHIEAALEHSSNHIQKTASQTFSTVASTGIGAGAETARHVRRRLSDVLPELGLAAMSKIRKLNQGSSDPIEKSE